MKTSRSFLIRSKLVIMSSSVILYTALNSPSLIFALWRSEIDSPSLEFVHTQNILQNPFYTIQLAQFYIRPQVRWRKGRTLNGGEIFPVYSRFKNWCNVWSVKSVTVDDHVPECHVTFGRGGLHNVWWDPHIDHKTSWGTISNVPWYILVRGA